jgi:hypothetical protein
MIINAMLYDKGPVEYFAPEIQFRHWVIFILLALIAAYILHRVLIFVSRWIEISASPGFCVSVIIHWYVVIRFVCRLHCCQQCKVIFVTENLPLHTCILAPIETISLQFLGLNDMSRTVASYIFYTHDVHVALRVRQLHSKFRTPDSTYKTLFCSSFSSYFPFTLCQCPKFLSWRELLFW